MATEKKTIARIILIDSHGSREEFAPDPDGLMWHYETSGGRRWIGWRSLAGKIELHLEALNAH